MFQHGLLVLIYRPTNITSLLAKVGSYLSVVNSKISKTLYVSLEPNQNNDLGTNKPVADILYSRKDLIQMVPAIYVEAHKRAPTLDVRVLHHCRFRNPMDNKQTKFNSLKRKLNFSPQIIFTNINLNKNYLNEYLNNDFEISQQLEIISLDKEDLAQYSYNFESVISDQIYDNVCLGGTFDNLHNGHKILLSTAQLKCNKSLTIGVTNEDMVKNKILCELIESPSKRMESLNSYLQDVDPFIEYKICLISDPFGPAIVDSSLQTIIVSEETLKGGNKINEIRSSKGMSKLNIDVIKILDDNNNESNVEEKKVSSSSLRIRKLGTLLKEPEVRPNLPNKPYLIGLTGIIASGKSSIAKKLEKLGAGIINVDLLAHKTYQSSTAPAYKKLIEAFGQKILDKSDNIVREKLAEIVFNDDSKLKLLNSIIWPEVKKQIEKEIDRMKNQYSVIVLEIALLIESGWMDRVHQIWLTILDEKEVVKRLMERNNLSEDQVIKRIQAMMPSRDKIKYANVVFSTYWDEEFTWQQVTRAWNILHTKFIEK